MMKKTALCLLALLLAGCTPEDPNAPPALRKALFKQMLRESEQLSGMLRGRLAFDAAQFSRGAAALAQLARQPWQHFTPPESGQDQGNARAQIWQQQARFSALARALEQSADALQQASQQPLALEALQAPMQQVENACKACHKEFRRF